MQEVKARGAYVIGIVPIGEMKMQTVCDKVLYVPKVDPVLYPIITVVIGQLIAYYTSLLKGLDVDKPRNLAKAVTVE